MRDLKQIKKENLQNKDKIIQFTWRNTIQYNLPHATQGKKAEEGRAKERKHMQMSLKIFSSCFKSYSYDSIEESKYIEIF